LRTIEKFSTTREWEGKSKQMKKGKVLRIAAMTFINQNTFENDFSIDFVICLSF
jgi:hypothetical protein